MSFSLHNSFFVQAIVTEIPPGSPVIKEVLIDKEAIRIMKAISSVFLLCIIM